MSGTRTNGLEETRIFSTQEIVKELLVSLPNRSFSYRMQVLWFAYNITIRKKVRHRFKVVKNLLVTNRVIQLYIAHSLVLVPLTRRTIRLAKTLSVTFPPPPPQSLEDWIIQVIHFLLLTLITLFSAFVLAPK